MLDASWIGISLENTVKACCSLVQRLDVTRWALQDVTRWALQDVTHWALQDVTRWALQDVTRWALQDVTRWALQDVTTLDRLRYNPQKSCYD
ncbi:unnamed protein product [Gadus morhua 'NCC']